VVLRPNLSYGLQAQSLRLKIDGNVSGGFLYYGSKFYGESIDKDGESGII
jgi:hypothetical protein